jgi:Zn-dependent M28 family amino/carboxypeptidase
MGVTLSPDPAPEQNYFVRSDHYSFVKKGVPSISLATGNANGGKAANDEYEATRYHRLSDDMSQKFEWSAGAKFAKLNYLIARDLADSPEAPRWYSGDYFGDKFAPKGPRAPR